MADIDDELFALAGGEEDAEEGEASSAASSPGQSSAGSAAMDESDSEADDNAPADDGTLYPLEGIYIDQKDKARIAQMSEIEREQLLDQRMQEKEERKFAEDLLRIAKQNERDNLHSEKKRKAGSADLDDNQRKSTRPKTKATSTLEAYKQQREQRDELRKRQNDRRDRRRSRSADRVTSDVDAEGESEAEWDEGPKPSAREELPAYLNHFEAVRVSRAYFGDFCFYPGFDKTMVGTFARVGVGAANGRTLYKMAQVKGFTQDKPYVFEGKGDKKIATNQYVIVQHGSIKKEYNFTYLSNGRFTEEDLDTYKRSQSDQNLKVPSRNWLEQKQEDMKALNNVHWTDETIQEKLKRQNEFRHLLSSTPVKETPAKSDSAAQRLAEINKANRRNNSEQVRKALIEERKAQHREREAKARAARLKEEEAKSKLLKVPTSNIDDLFEGSDRSRSGTPAVLGKASGRNTPAKTEKKGGIPTFRKKALDDDIISSMDLGIEIDI